MNKIDELRHRIRMKRPLQFAGSGKTICVSLPSLVKHLNKLVRGDECFVEFDIRKPDVITLTVCKKKEGDHE